MITRGAQLPHPDPIHHSPSSTFTLTFVLQWSIKLLGQYLKITTIAPLFSLVSLLSTSAPIPMRILVASAATNSALRDAWEPARMTDLRKWRVEVGGTVRASDALSVTFIYIDDDSYISQTPSSLSVSLRRVSCLQLHQLLPSPSLPPSLQTPTSPPPRLFPMCLSPGFTLLGDGPVAVALVVRWPAWLVIWERREAERAMEEGGESGRSSMGFSFRHYNWQRWSICHPTGEGQAAD